MRWVKQQQCVRSGSNFDDEPFGAGRCNLNSIGVRVACCLPMPSKPSLGALEKSHALTSICLLTDAALASLSYTNTLGFSVATAMFKIK